MGTLVVDSGRLGRDAFCQPVPRLGVYCNGIDANMVFDLSLLTRRVLGLPAPVNAPSHNATNAGLLTGDFLYRIRYVDASTGSISLPSPTYEVILIGQSETVNLNNGSPPARATHWILERNDGASATFWPVNVSATFPNGTPITTTTFADPFDNAEDFTGQDIIPSVQGIPSPGKWCFANMGRLFLGPAVGVPIQIGFTNGSKVITSGTGNFAVAQLGTDIMVPVDANAIYQFQGYTSSATAAIDRNYAGATGTKTALLLVTPQNLGRWSQANEIESFGAPEVGALSNEILIGNGEALSGGVGMGVAGVLWCKATQLFWHSYTLDPSFLAGGRIFQLPARRGALGPGAVLQVNGVVYGMDEFGVWRYTPGALPVEIGAALRNDWQREALDWSKGERFWIEWDPFAKKLIFWVVQVGQNYPALGFVWDLVRETWTGTRNAPIARTCAMPAPDAAGHLRSFVFTEKVTGAPSAGWVEGIGKSFGAPVNATPLVGVATGGTNVSLQCSTANFQNGAIIPGVMVKITRANGTTETQPVASNSATELFTPAWSGAHPVAGDHFELGPIEWSYRTGRMNCGYPGRKKSFRQLTVAVKTKSACSTFKLRFYADGNATKGLPNTDRTTNFSEGGVTWVAGQSFITLSCTAGFQRIYVPLSGLNATDIQIELFGSEPGAPPEILAPLTLEFDVDADRPARL